MCEECRELQDQIDSLNDKWLEIKYDYDEKNAEYNELEHDYKSLQSDYYDLKDAYDRMDKCNDEIIEENYNLQDIIDKVKKLVTLEQYKKIFG